MSSSVWLRAIAAIAILCATAVVAAAEPVRGVSGRWFAEGEEDGEYISYLVDRADDGTYKAEIKVRGDCSPLGSWIQTGRWTFRDGTLFTRTETVAGELVDPDDEEFQDSYAITITDDDNVTAVDNETNVSLSMRRVGLDFRIPADPACAV